MPNIKQELQNFANSEKAKLLQRYFKTGKGEYAEGDIFIGIVMPDIRKVAKKYFKEISLRDIQELLNSKIHEERMIALLVLVEQYKI